MGEVYEIKRNEVVALMVFFYKPWETTSAIVLLLLIQNRVETQQLINSSLKPYISLNISM